MSKEHTFEVKNGLETRVITKAKAIRFKCLSCCGFQWSEVKKCLVHTCPLFPFRLGNEKGLEVVYNVEDFDEYGNLIGEVLCTNEDCKNHSLKADDKCNECEEVKSSDDEDEDSFDTDEDEMDIEWDDDDDE